MSATFVKVYGGVLDSTIWAEPDRTRLVWLTMLVLADRYGRVMGTIPGLAHRARVPIEDTRAAIAAFLCPDQDSRTKDHEGRRIAEIDGGWRLLNYERYREMRSEDDRREQNRLAQQRTRDRKKAAKVASAAEKAPRPSAKTSARVSADQRRSSESAQAYAEAEIDLSSSPSEKTRRRRKAADLPSCPHEQIRGLFSEVLPELPQPVIADAKGRKKATTEFWTWVLTSTKRDGTRRAETPEQALAWIRDYFERTRSNDFLMGRTSRGTGHAGWECTYDYLLTEGGLKKVIEQTKVAA